MSEKTKFEQFLDIETDQCILQKQVNENGYGIVRKNGVPVLIHREALIRRVGEPPQDKPYAVHSCKNKNCFNYRHLNWGSPQENMNHRYWDENDKGPRGERNHFAKLTEEIVLKIRDEPGFYKDIAKKYDVSRVTVGHIKSRKTWGWL